MIASISLGTRRIDTKDRKNDPSVSLTLPDFSPSSGSKAAKEFYACDRE
jgi:hypothetical protein